MQGIHQRKYGVEAVIPFMVVAPDGVDLVVGWTPAAADLTVNKNGAGEVQCTNTAVDVGSSFTITLTATEMEAASITVTLIDAATKAVLDDVIIIETYGNASAQHAFDRDTASTAQTGDSYAVVNSGTFGNAQLVRATTPANTLDVSAGGEAGVDWANVGGQGTTVDLSATSIDLCDDVTATATATALGANAVDSTSIADNAITAAKINADAITNAKIADDAIAAENLATGALTADAFAADALVAATFATGAFTADAFAADALIAATFATDSISADALAADAATQIVDAWETQSQADPTGFHVNVLEVNGTAQTANDNGADINEILVDTASLNDGTVSQPSQGAPTTTPTLKVMNQYLYFALVNRFDTQTSGTDAAEFYDTAGTSILWKKLLTDDTDDYSEATGITGA